MKIRAFLVSSLLLALSAGAAFAAAAGPAQPCSEPTLAEMLEAGVPAPGPQPLPFELAALATNRTDKNSCTASCGVGSVTCSASGTCTAVDRNCPTTPGYVTCSTGTVSCPACACTNGAKRYTTLSGCCCNEAGQSRGRLKEEICVNGNWINNGIVCEGLNCPTICPK